MLVQLMRDEKVFETVKLMSRALKCHERILSMNTRSNSAFGASDMEMLQWISFVKAIRHSLAGGRTRNR
jgi:hypothetical protein